MNERKEKRYSLKELKKLLKYKSNSWWFSKEGYEVTHEEAVKKFLAWIENPKISSDLSIKEILEEKK